MKNIVYALAVILICGCNNKQKEKTLPTDTTGKVAVIIKRPLNTDLNEKVIGIWGNSSSENVVFVIKADSIYYPNHNERYKYILKGDSLFIYYGDFDYKGKVSFDKDTLILSSVEGSERYYRFKE